MALLTTVTVLVAAGTAQAASPGDVIPTGALALPAGAIPGGIGGYADGEPTANSVSADGRYVAFAASADELAPGAHPDVTNIFRKDRVTGEVVLVSRAGGANGAPAMREGRDPVISDDGGRVAWVTSAALDPADTDSEDDVYVRDIATAMTLLATPGTATDVGGHDLSGNGAFVAFDTGDPLAGAPDANADRDVYRRALDGSSLVLVSRKAAVAQAGNGGSDDPSISDDGRWVAFASDATDLVGGYVNAGAAQDVFARDLVGGATHLVSRGAAATTGGNGISENPDIAGAPGAALAQVRIGYQSMATDVAAGGVDASSDWSVYWRQMSVAASVLVSRATGAGGANADSRAHDPALSDSGDRVAFASDATNLGAGDHYYGVYVRDIAAATTALGSADNGYAVSPAISDDGAVVAWTDDGGAFTPDSDPDLVGVFARAGGGAPEYVSRPSGTAPFLAAFASTESPGPGARAISADGRYVVFTTYSTRLTGPNGTQVFRRDMLTGALELVSRASGAEGAMGDRSSDEATISADGTRVAFRSFARLDPADTDNEAAVYVRDLAAGTTTLASRADGPGGAPADDGVDVPRISAGGRHVAFVSAAGNLGAPALDDHAYLRDLDAGRTQVIDRASGAGGTIANGDVGSVAVSGDGRLVVFSTSANNLDPDDPAPSTGNDVYVRDTVAQTTLLVSRLSGPGGAKAGAYSREATISADGRVVAFEAGDQALAPEGGPWGGTRQVVARDLASGQNALVSRAPDGAVANAAAGEPSTSGDGSVIAFRSFATNLLAGVGGMPRSGVFVRTMATGAVSGPPAFGLVDNEPQNGAMSPSLSDDGRCLSFSARGHNAFTGTAGDFRTGYVYVIAGGCPTPQPPGGGPGPGARPAKPAISRASLLRKRFRVGKKATAKRAAAARRAKVGTAFRFSLSTAADVTITIQRRAAGKRARGKCRKPSRKLRKRPACVRYVKRGALVPSGRAAGRHRVAFSGRIGRKALKPGRYRATLVARNAAGASKPVRLAFRVVRR